MLHPHPDNPRKDLGDLEELRESIRENGIMQNLTVVPDWDDDGYKIVIGHRRFAASEGIIDLLPCVIADLSPREQVGIMLAENMQRSDLTFIEQAHGFQMMLDLGDTVETISEKTGFSKQTIKHRLEINKLKRETIEEAQKSFQLSISDFVELEKVKDVDARNEILENAANSEQLREDIKDYLDDQICEENCAKYVKLFEELGWKEHTERWFSYGPKWEHIPGLGYTYFTNFDPAPFKKAAERKFKGTVYYSNVKNANCVNFALKVDVKNTKKQKTKEELRMEQIARQKTQLEHARTDICDAYLDYILKLPQETFLSVPSGKIMTLFTRLFEDMEQLKSEVSVFGSIYNVKTKRKDFHELVDGYIHMDLIQRLMLQVWKSLACDYSNKFVDYSGKNEKILEIHQDFYDILRYFDFRLDAGLESIIDGTSELYLLDGKEIAL